MYVLIIDFITVHNNIFKKKKTTKAEGVVIVDCITVINVVKEVT